MHQSQYCGVSKEVVGAGGGYLALLWLSRARSPPMVTAHRPSRPQWNSHSGKFQGALASLDIQNLISPSIRWSSRSGACWLPGRSLPPPCHLREASRRTAGIFDSIHTRWGKCHVAWEVGILHVSHPYHDTPPFLNLAHLETMPSLLAKGVLLLHLTHWRGPYLGNTDWWHYNPAWPSSAHHINFANWPAVPPRMDITVPCDPHLPHSWSPLHSGYHTACLTQFFNKRIQTQHSLFH